MASATQLPRSDTRYVTAYGPALALPLVAMWISAGWPAVTMAWLLAGTIYAALKWLTFAQSKAARTSSTPAALKYLFLWPGMDASAFFGPRSRTLPSSREWLLAAGKTMLGIAIIVLGVPLLARVAPGIAPWFGLVGIALSLLFGLAHLLSVVWRAAGVNVLPIMNRPVAAMSLSDFWSNRWNLAFRDAARNLIFKPLVARIGSAQATMAVFLFSGVVHDIVMSLPARAGIGLPTLYFLIQGLGVLLERSRAGLRLGLGRGWQGRAFAATVVLGPLALLFHAPFMEQVIWPTLLLLATR